MPGRSGFSWGTWNTLRVVMDNGGGEMTTREIADDLNESGLTAGKVLSRLDQLLTAGLVRKRVIRNKRGHYQAFWSLAVRRPRG